MTLKVQTPDIYHDLHTRLVTGQLTHGRKLKPAELRDAYGCSANTIREVLLRLSTVGLVAFEDQRGFRVRRASQSHKNALTEFRILLEQEGVARSMQNGGIDWEAQLTAAHHKLSHIEAEVAKLGSVEPLLVPWCTAEWEFHETLLSASACPPLQDAFKATFFRFRQQMVSVENNYGYLEGNVAEHHRIVEAALARNVALCRQRIYEHLARNLKSEREAV